MNSGHAAQKDIQALIYTIRFQAIVIISAMSYIHFIFTVDAVAACR